MGKEKRIVAAVLSILFFTSASVTYTSQQEVVLFTCPYQQCSLSFPRIGPLSRHVRSKHNHNKEFECLTCKKTFSSKSNLRRHIKTHTDIDRVTCDLCGKTVSRSSNLKRHKNSKNCSKPTKQRTPAAPPTPPTTPSTLVLSQAALTPTALNPVLLLCSIKVNDCLTQPNQ